ncbi:Ras-like GTP-binding protein D [Thecamonas trahens ATCC 50062]|uniref:Ras-like GTP-binding protein D n=1 Tax=Thecamonas trahens ATCC 50062 TaxID=461836 RepID=A0A0L0DRK7_THETB|nr:Ras-like GTP-binding protein D [Thecamonas trahens ATCC 50062]KNC54925.1 Ras-like GTP-binding protein D [Thecamonas trahens ATCC 50062]|eukprot:XP_013753513.1 Ras-like GTP-binding protein D [Thecamonas trahens ATCC 50062]
MNDRYDEFSSGSVPYGQMFPDMYGEDAGGEAEQGYENKPRILLMGMRRSGKSSIQKVVFQKMSPNETLFLESTTKIVKSEIASSSLISYSIWDLPGQVGYESNPAFDNEGLFAQTGALIFVIDAQDNYREAIAKLHTTVLRAYEINPEICFEVFIHKVDGLSDDAKTVRQQDIVEHVLANIADAELEDQIQISFYLTSIYDHSIFEAFSKVIQKLIPQLPTLEQLLDILISNCCIEKAFLFDVVPKIYIADDSSPVDMQTYELCSDMIDVVIDVGCIYGMGENDDTGLGYDAESASVMHLNNGMVLYMKEVTRYLALVALLREDKYEKHGLIDYNVEAFKNAVAKVFEPRQ